MEDEARGGEIVDWGVGEWEASGEGGRPKAGGDLGSASSDGPTP